MSEIIFIDFNQIYFLDPFLEICFQEYFFRVTRKGFRVCPKYVLVQKIKVFEVNQYCQNN